MTISVLKFGGSSFPNLEAYNDVAQMITARLKRGDDRVVVVVSAMSGTTGKLLDTGKSLYADLSSEVKDTLLGSGEIVAACLMRIALEKLGVAVTQLTGYQLGFKTDSNFSAARISNLDATVLRKELDNNRVIVVSGGQAVDQTGRLTMLGRNSSDLSAVAIAAALGVAECEIFSDVPGVYSADPHTVSEARCLGEISYEGIISMALSGAKVLHHGAVRFAKSHKVRIVCRGLSEGNPIGTIVGQGSTPASVTVFDKNITLLCDNSKTRARITDALAIAGIESLAVDYPFPNALVIWKDGPEPSSFLQGFSDSFSTLEDFSLLTTINFDADVSRELVRKETCHELARLKHRDLYREARKETLTISKKQRATLSGLIVGA